MNSTVCRCQKAGSISHKMSRTDNGC